MLLSAAGIGNTLGRVLGKVMYISSYHIWQFVPKLSKILTNCSFEKFERSLHSRIDGT
jgi:hypothetical protein